MACGAGTVCFFTQKSETIETSFSGQLSVVGGQEQEGPVPTQRPKLRGTRDTFHKLLIAHGLWPFRVSRRGTLNATLAVGALFSRKLGPCDLGESVAQLIPMIVLESRLLLWNQREKMKCSRRSASVFSVVTGVLSPIT